MLSSANASSGLRVSISVRVGTVRTEFQSLQGKPNTHAWSTIESLPSNLLPFFPVNGSGPLSPTIGHHSSSLIVVVQCYQFHFIHFIHLIPKREWEVCPLAGPIGYQACRVPYLRHVASTFKRLINTTTHCGLIKILSTQTDFHHETS